MANQETDIIAVTIRAVGNGEDKFKFKLTTLVKEAKITAMKSLNIVPPLNAKYRLAVKKGNDYRVLDDDKTLEDENIKNQELLFLGTEQQVG